ncbi:Mg2 transporter protein, CorA family protein, putative [gamma proteobacterium HTCC5015]|nr:Mg2 transporter protein, CorA family protein, putative [gamma proteobacterium HTCC5015]
MKAWYFERGRLQALAPESLDEALSREGKGWLWLAFEAREVSKPSFGAYAKQFELHTLALTDAKRPRHPPKYEHFDENEYLILRENLSHTDICDFEFAPISIFWGERWLLTIQHRYSTAMESVLRELQEKTSRHITQPVDAVVRLSRRVNDHYAEQLLRIEERLEIMEDSIEAQHSDDYLKEVLSESTTLKQMARSLRYQHTALGAIAKAHKKSTQHSEHLLQDVLENVDRAATMAQMLAEISSDLMNAFLSLHAHRLNRIMQVLTVCTAVFLPLTLIAGIYGMNFEIMPELKVPWGYPLALVIMASCAGGMLYGFKRINWL